jgi:IstB-like ATP binding protein
VDRVPLSLRHRGFYCQPGITGAHEKGGVEGQIGWFRRNHLVPIPEVDSLDKLNEMVQAWDAEDDQRRIASRAHTIGEHFATEEPLLQPLPIEEFETGRWLTPRVDRYAQITVRMNKYSVPARLVGRQVRVLLHASELIVYDGNTEVTRHERLMAKGAARLELDHYLLCIDELGYMQLDRRGAELLFQVLTEREEKASVAIASNESFGGWTKTFTDPRLCAAIVDRLTFGGTIIETGTDSYRLAQSKQLRG